jgi:hypothetical protein
MNKQGKGVMVLILVVLALAVLYYGEPGAIILQDTDNVFYQYAGVFYEIKNSDGNCVVDPAFAEGGVYTSKEQSIQVGDVSYRFVTSRVSESSSPSSVCAVVSYDSQVYRDGNLIDSVSVPASVPECYDFSRFEPEETRIPVTFERDYGDVKAVFGYRWERQGQVDCGGRTIYVIHRYEVVEQEVDESVVASPNIKEVVVSPDSWFDKLLAWFKELIGGLR